MEIHPFISRVSKFCLQIVSLCHFGIINLKRHKMFAACFKLHFLLLMVNIFKYL